MKYTETPQITEPDKVRIVTALVKRYVFKQLFPYGISLNSDIAYYTPPLALIILDNLQYADLHLALLNIGIIRLISLIISPMLTSREETF